MRWGAAWWRISMRCWDRRERTREDWGVLGTECRGLSGVCCVLRTAYCVLRTASCEEGTRGLQIAVRRGKQCRDAPPMHSPARRTRGCQAARSTRYDRQVRPSGLGTSGHERRDRPPFTQSAAPGTPYERQARYSDVRSRTSQSSVLSPRLSDPDAQPSNSLTSFRSALSSRSVASIRSRLKASMSSPCTIS